MAKRALISVYDKTGIVEFAKALQDLDYQIISTGGTLGLLKQAGVAVQAVSEITEYPECLDGRVKTLHPKIHSGILAMRHNDRHMATLTEQGIDTIDLVAINLYPFRKTIERYDHTYEEAIENIDIGGPTMLRSAAKNHRDVIALVDPADYDEVIAKLHRETIDQDYRALLALKVFQHTAHYDAVIAQYLKRRLAHAPKFPTKLVFALDYQTELRYGENPHQGAALYRDALPATASLNFAEQLHGKALSFNNINDAQAAVSIIKEFDAPTCVAVKHANPCGLGSAKQIVAAYQKAYQADKISIFGGILAFNRGVTAELANAFKEIFIEVVIAPDYSSEALEILKDKVNIRLLKMNFNQESHGYDSKRLEDGMLIQTTNEALFHKLEVVTEAAPTDETMADLQYALKIVKHMTSNAIAIVKDSQTVGLGPGQVSRVDAARMAIKKAGDKVSDAVMASDGFIPFNDVIEMAIDAGIKAIIQPGGSKNDDKAIKACNEAGIAMIFTGMRHFKH